MGSNTGSCCATPEQEEQGHSCTEMGHPSQNISKPVCFYGTKGHWSPVPCPAEALPSPKASQPSMQEVILCFPL